MSAAKRARVGSGIEDVPKFKPRDPLCGAPSGSGNIGDVLKGRNKQVREELRGVFQLVRHPLALRAKPFTWNI